MDNSPDHRPGARPSIPLKRQVIYALIPLGVVFVLADVTLWLVAPIPDPTKPARDGWAVRSLWPQWTANRYVSLFHTPGSWVAHPDPRFMAGMAPEIRITYNALGFRSRRMTTVAKPPGVCRVFCIGGSTTECLHLDDDATWPERLGQNLQAAVGPGVAIDAINSGIAGAQTRDHLTTLIHQAVPCRPDVAVFLTGINDLGLLQMRNDYHPLRQDDISYRLLVRPRPSAGGWLLTRLCVSQIVRRVALLVRSGQSVDAKSNPVQDSEGHFLETMRAEYRKQPEGHYPLELFLALPHPEYRENLLSLVGVCRAHGILPVLLTQPLLVGPNISEEAIQRLCWSVYNGCRVPPSEAWALAERFNEAVRSVGAETGTLVVDLAREMPKSTEFFIDDCHFNIAGAREVGRIVARHMTEAPILMARCRSPRGEPHDPVR